MHPVFPSFQETPRFAGTQTHTIGRQSTNTPNPNVLKFLKAIARCCRQGPSINSATRPPKMGSASVGNMAHAPYNLVCSTVTFVSQNPCRFLSAVGRQRSHAPSNLVYETAPSVVPRTYACLQRQQGASAPITVALKHYADHFSTLCMAATVRAFRAKSGGAGHATSARPSLTGVSGVVRENVNVSMTNRTYLPAFSRVKQQDWTHYRQ